MKPAMTFPGFCPYSAFEHRPALQLLSVLVPPLLWLCSSPSLLPPWPPSGLCRQLPPWAASFALQAFAQRQNLVAAKKPCPHEPSDPSGTSPQAFFAWGMEASPIGYYITLAMLLANGCNGQRWAAN